MHIGVIADDLTGATDIGLIFAREGMRVVQVVGVLQAGATFADADVVVVSLKSRTIPAAEAIAMSVASADALLAAGAEQLFFKYCSTFDSTDKGNIGPVIDALLTRLGETRTIACPAFPANRRTIYKGNLFVGDVLLSESSMKDHPLTPMRDANLVRVLQRQTARHVSLIAYETVAGGADSIAKALAQVEGVAIVDALSDAHLRAIGAAAKSLRLVTGGAGVALGLPANFGFTRDHAARTQMPAVAAGSSVVLAGSCSEATRRQIAVATAAGLPAMQVDPLAIADQSLTPADAAQFAVAAAKRGEIPLLYSSAAPDAVAATRSAAEREDIGGDIEMFFGTLARTLRSQGFTRFLVAGGETSGAVVAELGVKDLSIGPEIDPGVPWTTSDNRGERIALALKSGNFGADDIFVKAWADLR